MNYLSSLSISFFLFICIACEEYQDNELGAEENTSTDLKFTDPENAGGCSTFAVHQYSDDNMYGLSIQGNRDMLNLTHDWQSFKISEMDTNALMVKLYQFRAPVTSYFCDDARDEYELPIEEWKAKDGIVKIKVQEDSIAVREWEITYTIDIILENAKVDSIQLSEIEFDDIYVGWLPG